MSKAIEPVDVRFLNVQPNADQRFLGYAFPRLEEAYGSDAKLAEVNKKLRERMGAENKVLGETLVPYIMAPDTIYSRAPTSPTLEFR